MKALLFVLVFGLLMLSLLVSGQEEFPGQTPPAGHNESCEASPILYEYFGTFCLHPVYWDIPGYFPRGYAIGFVNPDTGQNDIGRVSSYHWRNGQYVYQALYYPASDPLQIKYVLIAPSQLIPLPQLP